MKYDTWKSIKEQRMVYLALSLGKQNGMFSLKSDRNRKLYLGLKVNRGCQQKWQSKSSGNVLLCEGNKNTSKKAQNLPFPNS